jgi:hypothetical protein
LIILIIAKYIDSNKPVLNGMRSPRKTLIGEYKHLTQTTNDIKKDLELITEPSDENSKTEMRILASVKILYYLVKDYI